MPSKKQKQRLNQAKKATGYKPLKYCQRKEQVKAKPIHVGTGVDLSHIPSPLSPDEIVLALVRPKRGRTEPDTFKKEPKLRAPYTAATKNAR